MTESEVRHSGHSVEAALARGELSEEEAFFVLRFAGRLGYERAMRRLYGPWHTWRKWLLWVGGWEHPALSQWDRGVPAWEVFVRRNGRWRIADPTPFSLFGHRVTCYGWGWQVKCFKGYLVWVGRREAAKWRLYWSPNGTPWHDRARGWIGKNERRRG